MAFVRLVRMYIQFRVYWSRFIFPTTRTLLIERERHSKATRMSRRQCSAIFRRSHDRFMCDSSLLIASSTTIAKSPQTFNYTGRADAVDDLRATFRFPLASDKQPCFAMLLVRHAIEYEKMEFRDRDLNGIYTKVMCYRT